MTRVCTTCKKEKKLDECFGVDANGKNGRRSKCKTCRNKSNHLNYLARRPEAIKKAKAWYAIPENKASHDQYRRKWRKTPKGRTSYSRSRLKSRLKIHYGLTVEAFNQMLLEQSGVCKICRVAPTKYSPLHVDHDHATGRVRGLLCFRCNGGLGSYKDDENLLLSAVNYLREHRAA